MLAKNKGYVQGDVIFCAIRHFLGDSNGERTAPLFDDRFRNMWLIRMENKGM